MNLEESRGSAVRHDIWRATSRSNNERVINRHERVLAKWLSSGSEPEAFN